MPFKSKSQQRFMFAKHPKMAKRWAHETDDIKALPEKVKEKKASMTLLANVTVAMNAFELSTEGREKTGMHSITIGSFLNELEKIANALTGVAGAALKFKPGVTQAIPKLRAAAKAVGQSAGAAAGTVAGRGAKAMGGTMAGVVPKSLGNTGTSFKPPSGSLTGTHVRSGAPGGTQINTRVQPRSPGQGSTKINAPRPPTQVAGTATNGPARPAPPPSTSPAASGKKRGLMGTLALGGAALGTGALIGHAMPQQQPQQQQAY